MKGEIFIYKHLDLAVIELEGLVWIMMRHLVLERWSHIGNIKRIRWSFGFADMSSDSSSK
jgi:hypothetical protein